MVSVTVRLYEELGGFLPESRRGTPFTVQCREGTTAKALVEDLGVPHTEVDLLLVNGESVGFGRVLEEMDRVSVYPVFEAWDISGVSKVRPVPLRETRFVLDVHLGKLARFLRMMGFDAAYGTASEDDDLVLQARREARILLSRDRGLLKRRAVTHGYLVRSTDPRRQLAEVLHRFDLARQLQVLSQGAGIPGQGLHATGAARCAICNAPLVRVSADSVAREIPPQVATRYADFSRCPQCSRVFWRGTHWERMQMLAREALAESTRRSGVACDPNS
ncbi:MAG TPA: Mut7-C RNAse domain-containing protein [Spirochaetia bacterium]|nr:Mut7-C RNAse domain-containing protein [Spirochaetia bacterium]